jgi:hypothetical protein
MNLYKVQEGFFDGDVLFHKYGVLRVVNFIFTIHHIHSFLCCFNSAKDGGGS